MEEWNHNKNDEQKNDENKQNMGTSDVNVPIGLARFLI